MNQPDHIKGVRGIAEKKQITCLFTGFSVIYTGRRSALAPAYTAEWVVQRGLRGIEAPR